VYCSVLASEYPEFVMLLQEVLLEPRWDEKEFDLVKQSTLSSLNQQSANPFSIASNTYNILIYGEENVLAQNILGDEKSIESITMEDLKYYYERNILPNITKLYVVGSISEEATVESLTELEANWESADITIPKPALASVPDASKVYFYDVPDAKQSMLMIGYPAMAETDPDYYPSVIMNYRLGGGGFASQLTQTLREGKGYTYGIRSGFRGSSMEGPFTISSGVRSNVTLESTLEIKQILENYGDNYDSTDLETTKSALIKGNARAFETAGAKLNMLEKIGEYGWSTDYINDREEIIKTITVDQIQELAGKYIDPDKMYWLIVGDAKTQLERMDELGYGEPVLINNPTVE
jgi:zinc protease